MYVVKQTTEQGNMLILTRDLGQKIIIGKEEIVVTVLAVSKGKVKLGVTAPSSVPVDREEIFQSKLRDKIGLVQTS